MDLALAGSLAALALIDSTSFGTLLIPIWLLLTPGPVRLGRMLVFLGTVAGFYFAVGMLIALGAGAFLTEISALLDTAAASWVQLVLGAGLLALSFRIDSKKRRREGGGRVARWRERALGAEESGAEAGSAVKAPSRAAFSLAGLALAAATIEVATMLPYLAAIGMITAAGIGAAPTALTMAGYCLVMILPALVLVVARIAARQAVEPLLNRINDWMTRNAAGTTAWVVGIVGFLVARDAVARLGLLQMLDNL